MSNYPFTFSVVVYHGHDQETGESIYHRQQGMGFADSFAHAAGIIENYYGSELINIQKLELFEESDLILMPQSCIDEYKRREFAAEAYDTDISAPCDAEGKLIFNSVSREVVGGETV
jgi:hypothetical protein